jgi:hypothetical protein
LDAAWEGDSERVQGLASTLWPPVSHEIAIDRSAISSSLIVVEHDQPALPERVLVGFLRFQAPVRQD